MSRSPNNTKTALLNEVSKETMILYVQCAAAAEENQISKLHYTNVMKSTAFGEIDFEN